MAFVTRALAPYREGVRGIDKRAYFVVGMTLVSVASRMSLYTFLGIYFTRDLGLAFATVGLAYLAENVLRGLLGPIAGAVSDRIGRKPVLVASATASAIVLPGFLLVHDAWTLLAWAALLGAAQSGLWPATSALLLDLVPAEKRQAVLGLNYTALSIGYTLGVAPAGFLLLFGYPTLAAASASGFALIAAGYLVALRAPLPTTRESAARGSFFGDVARAPRDPPFVLLAVLGLVFPFGIGLIAAVAPVYAKDAGLTEASIGLALAVNGPLLALFSIPVAAALARQGPYRHLAWAAVFLAVSYLALIVSGSFWALVVTSLIFTAGELVFSSALPAAVAALAPAGLRGAYQGAWALVHALAFGGAFALTGLLQPALGWRATWIIWTIYTGAAAVGLALARPTFRRLADARAAEGAPRGAGGGGSLVPTTVPSTEPPGA